MTVILMFSKHSESLNSISILQGDNINVIDFYEDLLHKASLLRDIGEVDL